MTRYWCEQAWLPAGPTADVVVEVTADGTIGEIGPGSAVDADTSLRGLVLPGLANAHSHAFHRALRGRTHGDGGTFWTWRDGMYALADRLEPESYQRLATAVFAEMALAGVTCVGEFHYLHHRRDGCRYDDPNAMGLALVEAARTAGIRITLLDTCYLAGGLTADGHVPLAGPQVRFGDGDAAGWAARVESLRLAEHAKTGAAIHSVRGVPAAQLPVVVEAAHAGGWPLHVHLSEQPAENEAAIGFYGCTPTELLSRAGALGSHLTAVHATHLTDADIAALGSTGTAICACPTTEADLADGIGPFPELAQAGAPLCLGSDQHAHTDLLEEARRLEQHERLRSGLTGGNRRGTFTPGELLTAATENGHRALGWDNAGRLEIGARADLVALDLASVRTAGSTPSQILLSAAAADVTDVIADGQVVVRDRRHRLGDVGALLQTAIDDLWEENR